MEKLLARTVGMRRRRAVSQSHLTAGCASLPPAAMLFGGGDGLKVRLSNCFSLTRNIISHSGLPSHDQTSEAPEVDLIGTNMPEMQVMTQPSGRAPTLTIASRQIGRLYPPLVISEIGINHEGSFEKAVRMVEEASRAGCECVKFQAHVIED